MLTFKDSYQKAAGSNGYLDDLLIEIDLELKAARKKKYGHEGVQFIEDVNVFKNLSSLEEMAERISWNKTKWSDFYK